MKQICLFLSLSLFVFGEAEPPSFPYTIFQKTLGNLQGPQEEVELLRAFPKALYKIHTIKNVGAFYIDSRMDIIKDTLRSGKAWEGDFIELMKKHISPNSTALDIGAHIGTHTLTMSKLVGDKGCVVAFEPQIKLFSELVMNMVLNERQNVIAYRCALGDKSQKIEMNPAMSGNEGGTMIGKGGDAAEMIPLDSLNLEGISFIKLDVENFEYEVLLGAENTIRKNRPVIVLEIMGNTYTLIPDRDQKILKTIKKLEEMGYSLQYIPGSWSDWIAIPTPT